MNSIEDRPERDGQATAGPSGADGSSGGGFAKRKNRGNLRKRPAEVPEETGGKHLLVGLSNLSTWDTHYCGVMVFLL